VSVVGLLGVMTFESFFLGGVNFSNLYLALALTLMLPPTTLQQFRRSLTRLDSIPEGPQIAHGPDV
jgi:ABC-type phosphate transport system permease subunit